MSSASGCRYSKCDREPAPISISKSMAPESAIAGIVLAMVTILESAVDLPVFVLYPAVSIGFTLWMFVLSAYLMKWAGLFVRGRDE